MYDFSYDEREPELPVLLCGIIPPQHVDFFPGRVKSALSGSLFTFKLLSNTEGILRIIREPGDNRLTCFAGQPAFLAGDFRSCYHTKNAGSGQSMIGLILCCYSLSLITML